MKLCNDSAMQVRKYVAKMLDKLFSLLQMLQVVFAAVKSHCSLLQIFRASLPDNAVALPVTLFVLCEVALLFKVSLLSTSGLLAEGAAGHLQESMLVQLLTCRQPKLPNCKLVSHHPPMASGDAPSAPTTIFSSIWRATCAAPNGLRKAACRAE